jgi:hypothetical protein
VSVGAGSAQAAGTAGTIAEKVVATDPLAPATVDKGVGSPLSEHSASTLATGRVSAVPMTGVCRSKRPQPAEVNAPTASTCVLIDASYFLHEVGPPLSKCSTTKGHADCRTLTPALSGSYELLVLRQ